MKAVLFRRKLATPLGVAAPLDAVIPNATITILITSTGAQREDRRDSQGRYSFQQLVRGPYKVKAAAAGFGEFTIHDSISCRRLQRVKHGSF